MPPVDDEAFDSEPYEEPLSLSDESRPHPSDRERNCLRLRPDPAAGMALRAPSGDAGYPASFKAWFLARNFATSTASSTPAAGWCLVADGCPLFGADALATLVKAAGRTLSSTLSNTGGGMVRHSGRSMPTALRALMR